MPTKVSEKKLATGIVCLTIGIITFLNNSLINMPVLVSEKGMLYTVVTFTLIVYGIYSIKHSVSKV